MSLPKDDITLKHQSDLNADPDATSHSTTKIKRLLGCDDATYDNNDSTLQVLIIIYLLAASGINLDRCCHKALVMIAGPNMPLPGEWCAVKG